MSRKLVTFFSRYLSILGLNREFRKPYRLGISALLFTTASIQFIVSTLTNMDTIYGVTLPFGHLLTTMSGISCLVSFLIQNKNVHLLLKNIDQNIYIYSDESNIKIEYTWIEEENNLFNFILCIVWYSILLTACMCLSPFLQLLLVGKVEVLIYPGWIPWKTDEIIPFVCAYIINLCTAISCLMWYDIFSVLPLYVVIEFRRQGKRLCAALRNIEKAEFQKQETKIICRTSCVKRRSEFTNKALKDIIECIKHHQLLLQSFKLFQSFWNIAFSAQLAMSIVIITVSTYSLTETKRPLEIMSLFGIMSGTMFSLFVNCYIGEEFLKLHTTIKSTLFHEIKWYEQMAEVKKLLIFFHMMVGARPFLLNGIRIFQASYRTFTYICRTSYSYLNVLKSSSK